MTAVYGSVHKKGKKCCKTIMSHGSENASLILIVLLSK